MKNEMWEAEKMFDIVDANVTINVCFIPLPNANYSYQNIKIM